MRTGWGTILSAFLIGGPVMAQEAADVLLYNGRIYTLAEPAQVEAMVLRGDRIAAVGSAAELRRRFRARTEVDLAGRVVLPGLIDGHAHLMGLGLSMLQADLVGANSKEEILERLRRFAQNFASGSWIMGRGWDQNRWPEKAFPTAEDLDRVFPDRPVWLRRIDGHAAWANSKAMALAGITAQTPDPEGGKILRHPDGRPTGVFIDRAMTLVERVIPPPSEEELERALELAIRECLRYGITGVHDAGVDGRTIERYRRFIDQGRFPLRVYAMIGGVGETLSRFCSQGPLIGYGGNRLTVRAVKLYADGALGSRGAALLADYADDPGNRGLLIVSADSLAQQVERVMRCGFQVAIHAIGDRGNRVALEAIAYALSRTGRRDLRPRIEHAQVVALEDIARFRELGVIASMQPIHATSDMYWAEQRVGPVRIRGGYAWRRFLDAGVRFAAGSDFPVEPVNPFWGIYAAVTRQDLQGWPPGGWYPDQRLTRLEALRAFTLGAAYAAFEEDLKGSLEPGKLADFIVIDQDVFTIPEREIANVRVLETWLGGERVYRAGR
ncbi:MAG: amidohydrolase [Bacteroidota bacterium]|nr:amidohydrolase [Bacteroidota bacterium]MDW8137969.1 amidohydrolase [Bacteroidota bacterium]